jgi:hypothetical protein
MEWIKHVIDHACMELEINPDVGPMRRMIDLAVSEIYKEHSKRMERAIRQTRKAMIAEAEDGTT